MTQTDNAFNHNPQEKLLLKWTQPVNNLSLMSYQDFQHRVYSYLIKYKEEILKIDGQGISNSGVKHKCLFPKPYRDAKIPVMLYNGIKTIVEEIQESKFAYKPHYAASMHVASSQTACVNLFVPILESEYADMILKESGVAPKGFDHIERGQFRKGYCFEYWESSLEGSKGLLGDHSPHAGTDSDVAIAYRNIDNKLCLWLIEHKLTEREFTTCGGYRSKGITESEKAYCKSCGIKELIKNHDKCYYHKHCGYFYWKIMEKQHSFFCGQYEDDGCPFRGGMNQLWRNQLMAFELENRGVFDEVYFSVVSHPENCFLDKTMNEYQQLTRNSPKFSNFKSNTLVDKAVTYLPDWSSWYKKVYFGID